LGSYGVFLRSQRTETLRPRPLPPEEVGAIPVLPLEGRELFARENRSLLEHVLGQYVKGRRWFRSKARAIRSLGIQDIIPMRFLGSAGYILLVQVVYTEGEPETYVLPLVVAAAEKTAIVMNEYPHAVAARLKSERKDNGREELLFDGMVDANFCKFLLEAIGRRRTFKAIGGEITASNTRVFRSVRGPAGVILEPEPMKVEQSNTSVVFGHRLILKLFRRLEEGMNPDLEIGRFLTERTSFSHIAPVAGAMEYRRRKGQPISLAILQGFVVNQGDAWQYTLDSLAHYLRQAFAHPTVQAPTVSRKHLLSSLKELPGLAKEMIGPYMASAQLLGKRTAELHVALASGTDHPDFAPVAFTRAYQMFLYQSMKNFTIGTLQLLQKRLNRLPDAIREDGRAVLDMKKAIMERFDLVRSKKISAIRVRCHGDYHLGQVLYTGNDFVIIDFEGEPARSLTERRSRRSPIQDVAGMIRSFHYAAHSALLRQASLVPRPEDNLPGLWQWGQFWYAWVSVAFLGSYLDSIQGAHLLPEEMGTLKILLDAYLLEKAVYEIGYELNNRPEWIKVPIQGILQLIESVE
jgi:maltose alpha-D-glucosyltransferase/alpha-amylase